MTRNISEHMEVEIALLAGVLGFFLGGLINVRKEIIDIVFAAVVTGVLVFFVAYFAMKLVFSGTGKQAGTQGDEFAHDNYERVVPVKQPASGTAPKAQVKNIKGKRLDIISEDDSLFDDIYKK